MISGVNNLSWDDFVKKNNRCDTNPVVIFKHITHSLYVKK